MYTCINIYNINIIYTLYVYIYIVLLFSVTLKWFSELFYMRYCFSQSCNCSKLPEKNEIKERPLMAIFDEKNQISMKRI